MAIEGDVSETTATARNAMSRAEVAAFLGEKREVRLATLREDGWPHLTPVWYRYRDGRVWVTRAERRVHLHNLRRDPRATMLFDQDMRLDAGWRAGARAVQLRGTVEIIDDDAGVDALENEMGEFYLGDEVHEPHFTEAVVSEKRYVCVFTPQHTLTWDFRKAHGD
jgi:PPOX class probable F420-dependent enzyme